MAKRRGVRAVRDLLPNRIRGTLTFGAAPTTPAYAEIHTGLTVGQGAPVARWDILEFALQPAVVTVPAAFTAALNNFMFQLCRGVKTAWTDAEDASVIGQGGFYSCPATSGAVGFVYPFRAHIPFPQPVYDSSITALIIASDTSMFDNTEWVYSITYLAVPASLEDVAEYFAAVQQA